MPEHSGLDASERALLTAEVRRAMSERTGHALDTALTELGWPEILAAAPELTGPVLFRLLGETGAHAPLLLDVLERASADAPPVLAVRERARTDSPLVLDVIERAGTGAPTVLDHAGADASVLPFAGGRWVRWERTGSTTDSLPPQGDSVDPDLPLYRASAGITPAAYPLAEGRRVLAWWLLGTGHAMLALARTHALERAQFGRPLASFQAVRHRLAETLVALDGAEAALIIADEVALDPTRAAHHATAALLAKAAAGRAGLTAARHCQQVLGGIGFTAEHAMHRHLRRVLILDGLLGSTRELTQLAGATIRRSGTAIRIAHL
ncbi:acyl-CoA dehydrogenase family protein [Nocardia sp. FBN12]|uniref:acyl-CoA dehydrogenase family protein n=1 Tax=Nocardia sp. FBN12 TaxID=3419766 RepID=UPI003D093B4B